ncbi:MAG: glycine cleavage system protein H [Acidobacteria bacterium]|nr:glycine cleavage system protein H [Acidobacteriota bacterium]
MRYRRSRFATRLPVDHRFTRSHYWLRRDAAGRWRVGLTTFATRMLGDLVECVFALEAGAPVQVGQPIGSIEGFKAVSDIYAVASGRFAGSNAALDADITLVESAPYEDGWLYAVDGSADPDSLDVDEYVHVLDATIDRMLESRREGDGE